MPPDTVEKTTHPGASISVPVWWHTTDQWQAVHTDAVLAVENALSQGMDVILNRFESVCFDSLLGVGCGNGRFFESSRASIRTSIRWASVTPNSQSRCPER